MRIINCFATLGEYLGFINDLEWKRYGLIWLPIEQELSEKNKKNWKIFLHLESEAGAGLKRQKQNLSSHTQAKQVK